MASPATHAGEPTPPLATRFRSAFLLQYNLVFLFGCLSFALALASLDPVRIGGLVELLWLTGASASSHVSRWVAEQSLTREERRALRDLPTELRARVRAVRDRCESVAHLARRDPALAAILELTGALPQALVQLAQAHERASAYVSATAATAIESEISRLRRAVADEKDLASKLRWKHALALAQRQLLERDEAVSALRAVEAQMHAVEASLVELATALMSGSSVRASAAQVDALAAQVAECERLREHRGVGAIR